MGVHNVRANLRKTNVWGSLKTRCLRTRCGLVLFASILVLGPGCHRSVHRQRADCDAYQLLADRQSDPRWTVPDRAVEPDPRSRMADITDPDCGPKPPDDPAASDLMRAPYGFDNSKYWDKIPDGPAIDTLHWMEDLPRNAEGQVELTRESAIDLALLHSRDYQNEVESVYLGALSLSGNRFEFDTQWLGGLSSLYQTSGEPPAGSRSLSESNNLGFSRSLAAGGQLAANVANSFVWDFSGGAISSAGGGIALTLTQPLLRGAFRYVRLESLTQAERNLLYQIRDFAHFRREFYLRITTGYLNLLSQTQSIRNTQANLESLELNLREHEELYARQMVSQIQVDQVLQDYLSGRLSLYSAQQGLANAKDNFKFQLGLPPYIDIKVDQSLLKPFELNDARLDTLRDDSDAVYQKLVQVLPPEVPSKELLLETHQQLVKLQGILQEILPSVQSEFAEWQNRLNQGPRSGAGEEEKIDHRRQQELAQRIEGQLSELASELKKEVTEVQKLKGIIESDDPDVFEKDDTEPPIEEPEVPLDDKQKMDKKRIADWRSLDRRIGRRFREQLSALFIFQTQIRLFLIDVVPFDVTEARAIQIAADSRLDLMNSRARVTDAFRGVEIAANALQADLDVSASANLNTDPAKNNAFRIDSSANRYQIGLEFDGPLNRFNERNAYRAAQIQYQQSRRSYMAAEDSIANQIRADLRRLNINWLNFQVSRQQLIAAARQVDEAQFRLRTTTEANSSLTRDLLQALQGLLGAKNNLISNWIDYEIARITLFVDLELLYLDEEGRWLNERFNPEESANSERDRDERPIPPADPQGAFQPFENGISATRFRNAPTVAPRRIELDQPGRRQQTASRPATIR